MVVSDVGKILDKVKVSNTFLALGFILVILAFVLDNQLGLRVGFLTLIFGGVFRLMNIITKSLRAPRRSGQSMRFFFNVTKFLMWIIAFLIYAHYLNKLIQIF